MNLKESCDFVELEIGFGYSCILYRLADIYPNRNFIGIEMEYSCFKYYDRLIRYKNVKLIHGDAREKIKEIPTNSISRIHIYFPSPGPQYKRYITNDFIINLYSILKKGGILKIVTDRLDYFNEIQLFVNNYRWTHLQWQDLPYLQNSSLLVDTECEKMYTAKYYLECKKN